MLCGSVWSQSETDNLTAHFLQELEAVGILREDPRLANLVEMLRRLDPAGFGIDNVKLEQDQFSK